DLTLTKLNQIFQEVIRRQTEKIDPVRSKFGKIEKEEVTLPEKMDYISAYTKLHRRFSFRDLLMRQSSKVQVIVTFLAVLEMMKSGRVRAEQEETFGEIMITSTAEEEKSEQKENGGDH